jgi:hypothetical protein
MKYYPPAEYPPGTATKYRAAPDLFKEKAEVALAGEGLNPKELKKALGFLIWKRTRERRQVSDESILSEFTHEAAGMGRRWNRNQMETKKLIAERKAAWNGIGGRQ